MSIWFIVAMIALNSGAAIFSAYERNAEVAILMVAGVMANISALLMAMRGA